MAAACLLLALGGCHNFAPVESSPDSVAGEKAVLTGMCYSSLAASRAQVDEAAAATCPAGTAPEFVKQGWNLNVCPVLTPVRATYACRAPAGSEKSN